MITFIGDVHGYWGEYRKGVLGHLVKDYSIQVGDMGLGFPGFEKTDPHNFGEKNFFIRGNHDNPDICRKHQNYLGDWGNREIDNKKLFIVSGAWSIDKNSRIPGVSWWDEEELSYYTFMNDVIPTYAKTKPEIVVSHDCPSIMRSCLMSHHSLLETSKSVTVAALDEMFNIWCPKLWVYGHHHVGLKKQMSKTLFVSLGELETFNFEGE